MRHTHQVCRGRTRQRAGTALCVSAAALLTACTGDTGDVTSPADTAYTASVVSHHAQTLALLDLTLGRDDLDPQVGEFADEARTDLFAEVDAAEKRLTTWDEEVPRTALEHTHGGPVTYDTSIAGVLSNDRVHALEQATGAEFEGAWLRELITHERGAVELAEEEVRNGRDAAAVAAAEQDVQVHEERIAALRKIGH